MQEDFVMDAYPGSKGEQANMAQVVYYLCRNGKAEPPHMIDVAHPSQSLRLRDVKQRLTALRGGRMPEMFSWSFKRIYKNANIWQDVSDNDIIQPISSGEYVLKGSEIVEKPQDKVSKFPLGAVKQPELLRRKYWGAETWLASLDVPKPRVDQNSQYVIHRKDYEQTQAGMVSTSIAAKKLDTHTVLNEKEELRDGSLGITNFDIGKEQQTSSSILQDSSFQNFSDVKVYTIKTPAVVDHGCDAATQTEEARHRKHGQRDTEPKIPVLENKSKQKSVQDESLFSKAASPPGICETKKQGKFRKVFSQDKDLSTKTKNASWVFLHVLSYCGGVDTKARGAAPPLVSEVSPDYFHEERSRDLKMDGESFSSSDISRDTQQSRTSTGDSFQSSDASEGGRAHRISAFVDVKEMVVTTRSTSPSRTGISNKGFSFLSSRQYGRLSRSGTYCPRNIKYDANRRQLLGDDHGALKFELNCYTAE